MKGMHEKNDDGKCVSRTKYNQFCTMPYFDGHTQTDGGVSQKILTNIDKYGNDNGGCLRWRCHRLTFECC